MPMAATKRDYYEVLGVVREAPPTISRKPIARWPSSFIRTAIRVTKRHPKKFKEAAEAYEILVGSREASALRPLRACRVERGCDSRFSLDGRHHVGLQRHLRRRALRRPLRRAPARAAAGPGPAHEAGDRAGRGGAGDNPVDRRGPARFLQRMPRGRRPQRDRRRRHATTAAAAARSSRPEAFSRSRPPARRAAARECGSPIPAPTAEAAGRVPSTAHLQVDVPPGVESGMWLQLRNQGELGDVGAPRGNLRIQVLVKKHPFFERRRNDLVCQVPISFRAGGVGGDDRGADP